MHVECVIQSSYASSRIHVYVPPGLWAHPDIAKAVASAIEKVFKAAPEPPVPPLELKPLEEAKR